MMKKIVLIGGAGNIGSTLAYLLMGQPLFREVVLLDVKREICEGKALDIQQSCAIRGTDVRFTGTDDYQELSDADVVVVTAGLARQPGMSRDDLLEKNASILREIAEKIVQHAKSEPFVIVVTNPLDVMTWVMQKYTNFSTKKVVGMSGILDCARLKTFLAEKLDVSVGCISTTILGSHGDTMVPVLSASSVSGIPLSVFLERGWLSQEDWETVVERAKYGGAEIVKLFGTGSAYYTPATSVFSMVRAHVHDTKELQMTCARLNGEYFGTRDLCIGVPTVIGRGGVERIVEIPLSLRERQQFEISTKAAKELISKL